MGEIIRGEKLSGYFGIGVYHAKTEANIGTLMRSAYQLGASFVFTVGRRYKQQASDTIKAWRHIPVLHFADWADFREHIPFDCPVVPIEMGGVELSTFTHPKRCVYLLGAEDHGLPTEVTDRYKTVVSLAAERTASFNVAVAGSIVMYDRLAKHQAGKGVAWEK